MILASLLAGLVAWSLAEYLVHRFVLHRFKPFRRGHMLHHKRPTAVVGVPFPAAALLFTLAFVLAALGGHCEDVAFVCGFGIGYLSYVMVHEAMHRGAGGWLDANKRRHDVHHAGFAANYGVTTPLWDIVFGTYRRVL